eukprot:superscaffoldBa00002245_g13639
MHFYSANRKKADTCKTGCGPALPPLTEAEELALSQNLGRPVAEGIPGESSSSEPTPQDTNSDGAICLVEPPHTTTDLVTNSDVAASVADARTSGSFPPAGFFSHVILMVLLVGNFEGAVSERWSLR